MQISAPTQAALNTLAPATQLLAPSTTPAVPTRWVRWWKAPIAAIDYAAGGRIAPWREAWIPTERTLTGGRTPAMVFGGTSAETAIEAAHALARGTVQVRVSDVAGRMRTVQLNPAMAVLLDAKSGAYWITPLTSSVRSGGGWIELPHSIDGAAFEGAHPWLHTPQVAGASKDLVAVVGRERVVTPSHWSDAPHDSKGHSAER
ncbi:MAG: hypothetical protein H7287_06940 [Thermoleophilia bacterium]|nr:hypothetical protein [Thermoleophilia bacterium]